MSYTPTNWQTGDTVTAEKLNNMESGIAAANDVFVITCTPTAQDYSGSMDKTVAEIDAAYQAGQKIVFRVLISATDYMDIDCTARYASTETYPSFNAFILENNQNVLIFLYTGSTDYGTRNTYTTAIYPLTPMS